jgi:hypothetical protein
MTEEVPKQQYKFSCRIGELANTYGSLESFYTWVENATIFLLLLPLLNTTMLMPGVF